MNLVIILPTYNERENIELVLDTLHKQWKGLSSHTCSYLVVDDTSPDGTGDVIRAYQKKHSDTYLLEGKKEGLGKALLRGMKHAVEKLHAEYILQMDCDMSHDPTRVPAFIQELDKGSDFVVGSRYIKGGSIPSNWGIHRKIFSVVGNAIVRFGLGYSYVHDWTGGFRAYSVKYYELLKDQMKPYSGYVFQIAFLHKAIQHGARVTEVSIHFTDRKFGHSKIAPAEYIKNVLLYVGMNGPFGKFLVVGGLGFVINAVLLVIFREWAGLSPTVANLIGAAAAIFSNFNFNNIWTFREKKITSVGMYLAKLVQFYVTSSIGVLIIQTGTIALGVKAFGDNHYFIYFLIGTALLLIWNYTVYSKIIWKKK
jgi:dolichol-phosphate mannosyltransferase